VRPSRRDEANSPISPREYHGHFPAFQQAGGQETFFAVIKPVIPADQQVSLKYGNSIMKIDSMLDGISLCLTFIPFKVYIV
jgi:hypothetical protein